MYVRPEHRLADREALFSLMARHPQLRLELAASNELANLTRRDADLALRATRKPPEHLVGRHLGVVRVGPEVLTALHLEAGAEALVWVDDAH